MINRLGELAFNPDVHIYGLVGPGGCGKETKGEILCRLMAEVGGKSVRVCTSDVIRKNQNRDDDIGQLAKAAAQIMSSGDMVPDILVMDVLATELKLLFRQGFRTFLMDGFPRTVYQAKSVLPLNRMHVFEFAMNLETSLVRARARRNHAISHGMTPRDDDHPETVVRRFQVFQQITRPGIRVVKNYCTGRVTTIEATDPIRCQVVKMLKSMHFGTEKIKAMLSHLDNSTHPVTQKITNIEGRVAHRRNHRPELQLAEMN